MDETINYIRINESNPVAFQKMMERIVTENNRIPKKRKNSKKEVLPSRQEKELYEKVFDRLHSKEIYKEVTELLKANPDMPAIIRQAEFHLAEQKNESRELTLNSIFHTFAGDTRNYLVHRWEQLNEGDDVVEVTENGDILSSVNASIIMNLIENVMSLRAGDKYIRDEQWYQLKNAYNQSAENTLNRFFTDRTLSTFHIIERNDYSKQIQESITKETDELVYKTENIENLQKEALNEINIRNQQKLEQIRALEQQIVINNQATNPVPDRKNTYYTSQILLEHPELSGEIIANMPDNTLQATVYDQIKEVIVNQVADPFTRELLVHLAENGRPGDISELEAISHQQEVVRNVTEHTKQVEQIARNIETEQRTLTLVHKSEEQTISEDILDEIRQQRNYIDNRLVEVTQNVNTTETNHTEVINQTDNEEVVRNIQNNVMEMVDRNIKGQVDSISNQVFRKLEQKLDTERKRRGY